MARGRGAPFLAKPSVTCAKAQSIEDRNANVGLLERLWQDLCEYVLMDCGEPFAGQRTATVRDREFFAMPSCFCNSASNLASSSLWKLRAEVQQSRRGYHYAP